MKRFRSSRHGRARIAGAVLVVVAALAIGVGTSGASTTPKLAMIVAANNQNAADTPVTGFIIP